MLNIVQAMLHTLHGKFHEINTCGCNTQTKCSEAVYSSVVELSRVRAELPWGRAPAARPATRRPR